MPLFLEKVLQFGDKIDRHHQQRENQEAKQSGTTNWLQSHYISEPAITPIKLHNIKEVKKATITIP